MASLYEEMLESVIESCNDEKGFDWEEYQSFCNSAENNLWYDED